MQVAQTPIPDLLVVSLAVHRDHRGFFAETWRDEWNAQLGLTAPFVQDNHVRSEQKGVMRGLHFQKPPHTQAKLVRVTRGAVYDVIVDLRKDSPTYGQWEGFELTANNHLMLFVPRGFAHGFVTLEDYTEFQYKCDNYYNKESDGGIIWSDPELSIYWPIKEPILSAKDKEHPQFSEFESPF